MGCGASTSQGIEATSTEPHDSEWSDDCPGESTKDIVGYCTTLDELMARLLFDNEFGFIFTGYPDTPEKPVRKGLTEAEINNHSHVITVDADCRDTLASPDCAMCLEDHSCGEQIRILSCNHCFHAACVDDWLTRARTCPNCSQDITSIPLKPKPTPSLLPDIYSRQHQLLVPVEN
eukprot:TRINITY_DN8060_c1_g1_i1.p1 TRINITY_DN8060_c1_g1~~TRINITY_DN8060_c1_g1_i1.p1  ORF type:complete len:200 (+),score=27.37 TRINITY_DN8060_c1_g1_i1:73-600(+)